MGQGDSIPVGGRGPELLGTIGLFLGLASITTILRVYCRIVLVKNFGMDDYFAVLAYGLFLIYASFAILGAHHGTGQHVVDIMAADPEVLPIGLKWWWACEPSYILSMMAVKISIGIFLLRIAVSRVHQMIIWTVIIITEIYSAFFFFLFVLQCRPSSFFWTQHYLEGDPRRKTGDCVAPRLTVDCFYAYSAISCVGDWILGILPIFIVWNLQMNTRTKISVACILAVGAIASSATVIRLPYISGMGNMADFLWATTDVAIWSTVEIGIGITASAAATLRPLFRAFFSGSLGSQGGATSAPWGASGAMSGRPSGYMKSGKNENFHLRSDVGKPGTGTVTTIRGTGVSEDDLERNNGSREGNQNPGGWAGAHDESKLRLSSEDEEWNGGIIKTTKMTQVRE